MDRIIQRRLLCMFNYKGFQKWDLLRENVLQFKQNVNAVSLLVVGPTRMCVCVCV
jgi:hypothetical protein